MSVDDPLRPPRETPHLGLPVPGDAAAADVPTSVGDLADVLDALDGRRILALGARRPESVSDPVATDRVADVQRTGDLDGASTPTCSPRSESCTAVAMARPHSTCRISLIRCQSARPQQTSTGLEVAPRRCC